MGEQIVLDDEEGEAQVRPIQVTIMSARGLRGSDWSIRSPSTSDPYCIVEVQGVPGEKFRTPVIKKTVDPVWDVSCDLKEYIAGQKLVFNVWDEDWGKKDDFLGKAVLDGDRIA